MKETDDTPEPSVDLCNTDHVTDTGTVGSAGEYGSESLILLQGAPCNLAGISTVFQPLGAVLSKGSPVQGMEPTMDWADLGSSCQWISCPLTVVNVILSFTAQHRQIFPYPQPPV